MSKFSTQNTNMREYKAKVKTKKPAEVVRDQLNDQSVPIVFVSHPVASYGSLGTEVSVKDNIDRVLEWIGFLRKALKGRAVLVCPWVANILAGEDDAKPEERAQGLGECLYFIRTSADAIIQCCDTPLAGLVPYVSEGMKDEAQEGSRKGIAMFCVRGWSKEFLKTDMDILLDRITDITHDEVDDDDDDEDEDY